MGTTLKWLAHRLRRLSPVFRNERRLMGVQDALRRIEHIMVGSSATYLGNNLVLVRVLAGTHIFLIYTHADDKLISPWLIATGRYEPEVTDYFVRSLQPGSHCIDVGANLGYFSVLMAKHCPDGKVLALEPNPLMHALAADNILINSLHDRIEIMNVAASDRAGEIKLFHRIGRAGNTSMAECGEDFTRNLREPPEEPFDIQTMRVDDLLSKLNGRVDFIKIDVEGAEPLVFSGALEVIARNPQINVVMEWAPGQIQHAGFDLSEFVRNIAAAGLQPHTITTSSPRQISHDELVNLPYQAGVLLRCA